MRKHLLPIVLFLLGATVWIAAQATHLITSGTLPAHCRVGDLYVKTGTSAGLHRCSATDTWTRMGDSSAAGDFSTNTTSSAAGEMVTFADTAGKTGGRSLFILAGPASSAKTYTFPNLSSTMVARDSTDTLTNKTIDAEGTGNTITVPMLLNYVGAVCQNTTATLGASTPTSNPAVAACVTGSNTQFGVADFAAASNLSMQGHFTLPADWTGAIDWKGKWFSSTTSGDVVWQVATICVADAETSDPSFNTASTVTDTTKGTTNQQNDASITGVTATGCAAGEELYWKLSRNAGSGSDTMSGTARLVSFVFVIRRAM